MKPLLVAAVNTPSLSAPVRVSVAHARCLLIQPRRV